MKFGVILHKTTRNRGDDIQTYASLQHLPQVDYVIEREALNSFCSENNEPVAVIMSAWWMWKKWNWPPAECIIPKLTSMHINNYTSFRRSSPIRKEWLEGIGGEFFRNYGPVGARDQSSLEFLKDCGFDSYFSGCITLTLPKQKKTKDAGTYVCLVDLNESVEAAAREALKDTGLQIRTFTHDCNYIGSDDTLEDRMKTVENLLTQYQNAKCVITRRLHVALPCLAMEVPVLAVVNIDDIGNSTRWEPYTDWFYFVKNGDFKTGNFEYDFNNPPANKDNYKAIREALIKDISEFTEQMKNCDLPLEQVKKTTYTKEEAWIWRNTLMELTLSKWLLESRSMFKEKKDLEKELKDCKKVIRKMDRGEDVLAELEKKNKENSLLLKQMRKWWIKIKSSRKK